VVLYQETQTLCHALSQQEKNASAFEERQTPLRYIVYDLKYILSYETHPKFAPEKNLVTTQVLQKEGNF
jgi:hypothetical protein